jgi:cytochrome c553
MKVVNSQRVLQAVFLAIVFAAAARADDIGMSPTSKGPPYSRQAVQGKIEYCQTCHGPSAEGVRGSSLIPRLAGQQVKYLEGQLRNFMERGRHSNVMSNVLHDMSPAEVRALATYFSDLNPKPLGGAPTEMVVAGKNIYLEGVPEANVLACASCHGAEAKGDGAVPRLAGQLHDYIFKKLTNWEKERDRGAMPDKSAATMQPVAHSLTEAQIVAVAAYLSYLE